MRRALRSRPRGARVASTLAGDATKGTHSIVTAQRHRVLVVEDDPFFTRMLRDALAPLDLDLVCVGSAEEALASSALRVPDLVLADYVLPGRNGFDLLAELGVSTGGPKRVLVTGRARLPSRWGQDIPVLFKPFKTATVQRLVGELLAPG